MRPSVKHFSVALTKAAFIVFPFLMINSPLQSWGQSEELIIQWDKEVAYPGDSIWFCVNILTARRNASSNVHVELYDEKNVNIQDHLFRCFEGVAPGQIRCPDSAGRYWIRFYTLASRNTTVPITVRGRGQEFTIIRPPDNTTLISPTGGLVIIGKDTGGYYIRKQHPSINYYSVAVTDTAQPLHLLHSQQGDNPEYCADTNLLSFDFKVRSRRNIAGKQLITIFEHGNQRTPLFLGLDSTQLVHIDSMSFDDSAAYFHYELNGHKNWDFELEPVKIKRPFSPPIGCRVDSIRQKYIYLNGIDGVKPMDTARVYVNWQDRNKGFRNRLFKNNPKLLKYKGMFMPGFDFGKDPPGRWDQTLGDYFNTHPFHVLGGIRWVLCETRDSLLIGGEVSTEYVFKHIPLQAIRFIDFEDGFLADKDGYFAYGIIVMKEGKEARDVPSSLKYIRLTGYTRPIPWTTPDRITKNWIPFSKAEKTYLTKEAPFKVSLLIFVSGHPFYIETTIDR